MFKPKVRKYQFLIKLNDIKPEIWRRVWIPSDFELIDFHYVIQTSMGWADAHMHMFIKGEDTYCFPDPDDTNEDNFGESEYALNDIFSKESETIEYMYDMGDGWEHILTLEKIIDEELEFPVCLDGKRACPPEDIGGSHGYMEFLKALKDIKHPMHNEYMEWIGGKFDPEHFDLELVNAILKEEWGEF